MSWRRELSKIQAFFRRQDPIDDMEQEMTAHLKMEERENLASGMSPDEAHFAALRRFGNVTRTKENSRAMWGWQAAEALMQDVHYGIRQLRRNPGFTVVAVLTLSLGIGATTAIFSIVNAVLLKPLPFKDPSRLVQLSETESSPGNFPLSGPDYLDWQSQNRTLQAVSLFSWPTNVSASGFNEPEAAAVIDTQANFFDVLGVSPLLGRTFAKGEDVDGKNHIALLSYAFWKSHFGADPGAIGKTLLLNNTAYTVIGVMPRWFNFVHATDVWTPLDMSPKALGERGSHSWWGIGRVKNGFELGQARGELLTISERLEKQHRSSNYKVHAVLTPLQEVVTGNTRVPLLILLGAVALVLLVVCVNVANLQLARASTRHREMAVRSSLGAGKWRLVRQMLTESVLLSLTGALFGVLGAWWSVRLLASATSIPLPRVNPFQVDGVVLLFAVTVGILTGVLFGLAPALQTSGLGLNDELKAGAQSVLSVARSRRALRDVLVVAELAVTLALLIGAGLLLRSFAHLRGTDIGVDTHNVLTAAFNLPETKYPTLAARRQFFDRLLERMRTTPGVESASISSQVPLYGGNSGYLKIPGNNDPAVASQLVNWNYITLDYFRTFHIPLLKGRTFSADDLNRSSAASQRLADAVKAAQETGTEPKVPAGLSLVAIISQTTARTFWGNQDPVGRSFQSNDQNVVVIGVVRDVKEFGIRDKGMPEVYYPMPLALAWDGYGHLLVKTRTPPQTVWPAMRRHLRELDAGMALLRPTTMEEVIADSLNDISAQTFLLGSFALLALLLAAIGLYGVMSYLVTQRTREIGIRMALGAQQSNVLKLILKRGAVLTLIGIALGMVAALALTRSLASLLYGVSPADPPTFAAVAALLALVAFAAYYIPARRATQVDPTRALRQE